MIAAESGPRPARDFINYVPTSRPGALAPCLAARRQLPVRPFRPGLHAAGGFGVAGRYRGGQGRCPARRRPADRDPARRGRDRQPVSGPPDPDPPRPARGLARRRLAGRGRAGPSVRPITSPTTRRIARRRKHEETTMLRNEDIAGATQAVALFRNRVLPLLFAGYLLHFSTAPISAMPSCRWAPTWTFRWPPTAWARPVFLRLRQRLRAGQPRAAALRRPALAGFHVLAWGWCPA